MPETVALSPKGRPSPYIGIMDTPFSEGMRRGIYYPAAKTNYSWRRRSLGFYQSLVKILKQKKSENNQYH
jgi:hypothetical protein